MTKNSSVTLHAWTLSLELTVSCRNNSDETSTAGGSSQPNTQSKSDEPSRLTTSGAQGNQSSSSATLANGQGDQLSATQPSKSEGQETAHVNEYGDDTSGVSEKPYDHAEDYHTRDVLLNGAMVTGNTYGAHSAFDFEGM